LIAEVELTFQPVDGGTEVGLEHRNLERFRKQTATWTAAVAEGWRRKLDEFAAFADLPDQEE
jgi:hypothetical protein